MKFRKFSWRNLVGEVNICGGGHLAAIVFCCDPRKKRCPFRDYALKRLEISVDRFVEVKDKHKIEGKVCFGNLAYCCSPEKNCSARDRVLAELGWSYTKYLQYKWEIFKDLVPKDKWELAFTERVLKQYAMELLELDTRKIYKAMGYGNIGMKAIWISEVVDDNTVLKNDVGKELGETEFVGVRVPRTILRKIDDLVDRGVFKSRSQAIRSGLTLLLKAYVKQEQ